MAQVIHVISSGGLYGAERSILGLIKSVQSYTHKVICFNKPSSSHMPFVEALRSRGISVRILPDGYGALRANARRILQSADPGEPPRLHAHGYKGTMTSSLARKLAPQTRIICTQHGFTNKSYKTRAFTKLETLLIKSSRVDHVICASELIRSFYLNKNVPADKITYVANSVEIPAAAKAPDNWHKRDIDCLYLGRLSPEKGPDVLLRALAEMKTSGATLRLNIAGDGPLLGALQAQVSESGLADQVSFLGYVSDPSTLLKRSRWLVMPSLTEGLPMSALEAMSHGTPLIASSVGELPTVTRDGSGGILIPPGDSNALAQALSHAITMNEAEWLTKAESAFEIVSEHYALGRYGREIAAIYDKVFASEAKPQSAQEAHHASSF